MHYFVPCLQNIGSFRCNNPEIRGGSQTKCPPKPPPGSALPPPFMHLYRLVFSKSRCLWPSLSDLFFGPFGLLVLLEGLYSPLKSKKSLGRGRSPPCTPPSAAARRVRRCAAHGLGCAQPAVQRPFRSQTPIQRPFRPKMPISFICAVVPPLISGLLVVYFNVGFGLTFLCRSCSTRQELYFCLF